MRIDNGLTNPIGNGNGLGSVGQVGSNSRVSGTSADDRSFDNVTLSSASNLVSAAKNAQSTERQAKIASLTAQVRSGSYRFDAQAVSQALIKSLK
ncbi:MAG TPA: flagellar biosynthesis anti-sigma factor FlgM [Bryobacteraceae bacterium]|jgi:flagellar biosynthesis anti-sigma factor FlgM|nr:flagellar biosynthesis anti-sigma factor FlgM [Bryobacteraceae bacterium]